MKYPCDLIKDLLPLYHDGVCSADSAAAVEAHLKECASCQAYYQTMCSTEATLAPPENRAEEVQKAASFRAVRRKLFKKQILLVLACFLIVMVIAAASIASLRHTQQIIAYEDNITISLREGDLVGRLSGSTYQHAHSVTVTASQAGQEKEYVFFYLQNSKWDQLTARSQSFSEYTICPAEKGADDIDAVYYYTGVYTDLSLLEGSALQDVLDASTLLWHK